MADTAEERTVGRYDDECEACLATADGDAAILIILGGIKGSGFSCCVKGTAAGTFYRLMPAILRHVADDIEANGPPGHGTGAWRR